MPPSPSYRPSRRHADLGEGFFDLVEAAEFPQHVLRYRNQRWAARVGLDGLSDAEWIAHFGRFVPLPGSFEQPLALRYHGHQFQVYNPELGDGRGFLFAQLHDLDDGRLLDLGTKGSGRTPWSRGGDGRLTLKGGVREVLATAMLEALGRRHLQDLQPDRDRRGAGAATTSPRRRARRCWSGSATRTSASARFQRFAYHEDRASLSRLLDYTVADLHARRLARRRGGARGGVPGAGRARSVARTGAQWMAAGFVHGVLNTDNINITGESFDYGPWRFLPTYDPGFTAAYFDETGLYAFGRQPTTLLVEPDAARRVPAAAGAAGGARGGARRASGRRSSASWPTRCCARLGPALRRASGRRRAGRARCSASSSDARRRSSRPSSTGAAASPARSAPRAARRPATTRREAFAPLREALARARAGDRTRPRPSLLRAARRPARC